MGNDRMPLSSSSVLHAATHDLVEAAARPDGLQRIETVLRDLTSRLHSSGLLAHEEEDDEVLLHASRQLTIYHITLSPGLQYPPHNHRLHAFVGIYRGGETNFVYPDAGAKLGSPERREHTAPSVLHLPPHTIHSVANTGSARSGAVHVYLGDLPRTPRQLWSFQGDLAEPFDNDRYLAGARRVQPAGSEPQ
jgi:predicted metal-dependent enzyme (double-stranded beta helix superfamily)